MREPYIICDTNKKNRTITIHLRENFGDGKDDRGLMNEPEAERQEAHNILDQAIDVIIGKK